MIPAGGDPIYPVPINSVRNSSHALLVDPEHEKCYFRWMLYSNQPVQSITQKKKWLFRRFYNIFWLPRFLLGYCYVIWCHDCADVLLKFLYSKQERVMGLEEWMIDIGILLYHIRCLDSKAKGKIDKKNISLEILRNL